MEKFITKTEYRQRKEEDSEINTSVKSYEVNKDSKKGLKI